MNENHSDSTIESQLGAIPTCKGFIETLNDVPKDTSDLKPGDGFVIKNQPFCMVWDGNHWTTLTQAEYVAARDIAMFVKNNICPDENGCFLRDDAFKLYNRLVHEKNYEFLPEDLFWISVQRQMAIQYGATVNKYRPFRYSAEVIRITEEFDGFRLDPDVSD